MGLLADSEQARQEKHKKQFISLFDSILYLGEPLEKSLQFVIDIMPYQSILYLTANGLQKVFIGNDRNLWSDDIWSFNGCEMPIIDIIQHLTDCAKQGKITQDNPIYHLGFNKHKFLYDLADEGIKVPPHDLETVQSPDLVFDDGYEMDGMDFYTIQSIIQERDELREKLANQTAIKENQTELATKSKNAVAKILLGALEVGGLDWKEADPYDYNSPNSINTLIFDSLIRLSDELGVDLKLSQQSIGNWIKSAQEQTK